MKITAKQIAQELGMSAATVSMVLNQKPGISEVTKKLVFNKAQELGYTKTLHQTPSPNRYIHLVLYNRNNLSFLHSPFFQKLLEAAEQAVQAHGYQLIMSHFYEDQRIDDQLYTLMVSRCEGYLILATNLEEDRFRSFEKLPAPVIILDNYFPSKVCDMVSIDNRQAITDAFQYLVSQGHSQIGYLSSNIDIFNYRQRKETYLQLLRSTPGFTAFKGLILKIPRSDDRILPQLEQYLSKKPKLPTAFLTDTDGLASPCILTFQKCGYRIPEDISIIGFDNTPAYHLTSPALTTLDVDTNALIRLAAERLVYKINNPTYSETVHISLHAPLIIRQSVSRKINLDYSRHSRESG